jgi:thiamine kinase-like enzyme
VNQIDNRLLKLENNSFQELSTFIETAFKPLWTEVKDKSLFYWSIEDKENLLPVEKQTLSPSDFGFHNSIKIDDGSLTFLDFDYFGWDDPVKLTADFIWHPAMNLDKDQKSIWQKAMLKIFNDDKYFEDRLNATMPLYGLRWALIILNEFLPGFADRRKEAGESKSYEIKKVREIQLKKAHTYCEKVKIMVSQVTFA